MSSSELTDVALPELVSFIVDNRGRTCPVVDEGFPLIATNSVVESSRRAVPKDVRFVDDETYRTWFRAHPEPNDVLFVCKGTPGKVALVPDPVPFCIAQDMVALRANPETADPAYLYYRLSAPDVRETIEGLHVGSLIPHFKKGDFGKLRFRVHPVPEQRRIAAVLSSLDDLIEHNQGQIRAVRSLSGALYRRLAEGSDDVQRLGDVANISQSKVKPGTGTIRYIDIAAMGDGAVDIPEPIDWADAPSRARVAADNGATLWSTVRPNRRAHALLWHVPQDVVVSTGIAVLQPCGIGPAELFAATDTDDFTAQLVSMADGSAYPAVRPKQFEEALIPRLSPETSARFETALGPLWADVDAAQREIAGLVRTRDELLPQLMSGTIRVAPSLEVA